MARIDKTDSAVGVTRAELAFDVEESAYNKIKAVGLNAAGRIVYGAGNSGVKGIIISDRTTRKAGKVVDIFKLGEVVDCEGLTAGTTYYADATTGDLTATAADGLVEIGYTIEAERLVLAVK